MGNGFIGKLPAHGDFVGRGLVPGARPVLDRWLTQLLRVCGPDPALWPPGGVRGVIAHAGSPLAMLVLPSRDAAGREFPLAAVSPAPAAGHARIERWAKAVLPVLRDAAEGGLDATGLIARLEGLEGLATAADPALTPPLFWTEGAAPEDPVGFAAGLAAAEEALAAASPPDCAPPPLREG